MASHRDAAGLKNLLASAAAASPGDRISYRDRIAGVGADAIAPMSEWLADARLGAFAVRVLERIGQEPDSREDVVRALLAGRDQAGTPRITTDINDALDRMGVRQAASGRARGTASRPTVNPGLPGRGYWAMHTWERSDYGTTQRAFVWAELQRGRFRQGWGWDASQDLRLIAQKVARGIDLDGTERIAWRARRMLTDRDDSIHVDDIVVAVAVPEQSQFVVARVTDGYRFEIPQPINDYGHNLPVELVAGPLDRHDARVSPALQAALRNRSRLWRIDGVGGDIEALARAGRSGGQG